VKGGKAGVKGSKAIVKKELKKELKRGTMERREVKRRKRGVKVG